ncbi:MAG: signal recognition particle-docking protein FtsY [SAR324 cluster bacterium]|nr:signal recognition particle-docking protein FtsY [SAR324 cluster bacterium]MDP7438648.1 signal recognition particle-docking protein FtsY [SAR324 cluster bacterium]
MFIEKLKQIYTNFTAAANQLLSGLFNDGVLISEEKMPLILAGFALLILLTCLLVWFLLRKRSLKNKAPHELSGRDKEQRLAQREKERAKELELQIKQEEKLQQEKEAAQIAKAEELEKDLQEQIASVEEERRNQQVLEREIEKDAEIEEPPEKADSFIERLRKGVGKTRTHILDNLSEAVLGKKEIDEDLLDDLEEVLIGSDIGPETTQRILESITEKVERKELTNPEVLQKEIQLEIEKIMSKTYPVPGTSERKPLILLFVGVNGVGKTTTIGKIAAQYSQQGKKVLMGAGDTFRAAAIEQLVEWSMRADCDIVQKDPGSDPSAVMYETVQKGLDEDYDVVICDTAGRLHTKKNLMEELKKMIRVIRKLIPDAPHEVLLVLDATTGQNAIFQTREFLEAADLTGMVITKLDGTSKGGVVIGIVNEFEIPVRYIGIGEQVEDLRPFDAKQFTESLFA